MRTLSVRSDHAAEDIQSGRDIMDQAIAHPSKMVLLIRRVGPEITRFADKVAARTDPFPWREAVWVTDQRLFRPGEEARLFAGHDSASGVILNLRDVPVIWLDPTATVPEVDEAFLEAESVS
jgi:hypothetical protein